jgi:hypothetical protein
MPVGNHTPLRRRLSPLATAAGVRIRHRLPTPVPNLQTSNRDQNRREVVSCAKDGESLRLGRPSFLLSPMSIRKVTSIPRRPKDESCEENPDNRPYQTIYRIGL